MIGQTSKHCKSPVRIDSTRIVLLLAAMSSVLVLTTCQSGSTTLTAEVPLHLEDHLDAATIVGSEVPQDIPESVVWNFSEPQPDWRPFVLLPSPRNSVKPATVARTEEGLRIKLTKANDGAWGSSDRLSLGGGIFINLPDWRREDWSEILVRARTSDKVRGMDVIIGPRFE